MTEKRFNIEDGYYQDKSRPVNELAEGNEEQCLKIMTYLHDNYYDIWEEVNKECF